MLKVMMLLKRNPGLSLAEFMERYERIHVPLAEKHATKIKRYERHYLQPAGHVIFGDRVEEPEYDVITELWYENAEAFNEQQDSLRQQPDTVAAIIADEESLFDRAKSRCTFVEDRVSDITAIGLREDLAREVRRLQDKAEIVDLVHRYSYLVDHRLYDELVELFTEDCLVDYGPGIAPPIKGRGILRTMFGSDAPPTGARPGFVVTSHHNANVLITFDDDDRATVLTSVYAWHQTTHGENPRVWGYYHDVAVRTPVGWRLAQRQLRAAGNEHWDVDWIPLRGVD